MSTFECQFQLWSCRNAKCSNSPALTEVQNPDKMGPEHGTASGMISNIFPCSIPPRGLIRVLTPLELRGQELSFLYDDVELSPADKAYLSSGMVMEITIDGSHATNVKPIPVAEYQGSVVRGPQARASGHGFIVSLDLTLVNVKVSADSYNQLKLDKPPLPGDFCRVSITWEEMLLASKENRTVFADIVSLMRRPPRVSVKHNVDETLDLIGEMSALEITSNSITDRASFESPDETFSDETSFPSGSMSPERSWNTGDRQRDCRSSVDDWSRVRDGAQRSNVYAQMEARSIVYNRFIRATLRPPMTPQLRDAFMAQAFHEAAIPNYSAGICRPSPAAMSAFYLNHLRPSFNYQIPYQYTYGPVPMCPTHGYIL